MAAAKKSTKAKKSTAKKSAAKKASPKSKATKPKEDAEAKKAAAAARKEAAAERRAEREARDAELTEQVVDLRSSGEKWEAIADKLGISQGKAQMLLMVHESGDPKVNATPARVRKDRDEGAMSWPAIAAKYGISKGKVQNLYREAGGDPHASYIGKGGRYFSHEEKVAKEKGTTKSKAKSKKSAKPKKATGDPIFSDPDDVSADDVREKIEGKTITWAGLKDGREMTAKVKPGTVKVGKQKNGTRVVQFNDGTKSRTVPVGTIVGVKS